jgi:hypothetical protein
MLFIGKPMGRSIMISKTLLPDEKIPIPGFIK